MRKRFIVAVDKSTTEQDLAFQSFIKASGFKWWHWLSNLWLLIDEEGNSSAKQIRDRVVELYPGESVWVEELSDVGDTWAAFGPKSETRNMFPWLVKNWKP
jgi:hypothetical protein